MDIKVIKTDEEYNAAIDYLEVLGDMEGFQENPAMIQQFELLSTLVGLYEKENFPIKPGHPLEIIKLKMDSLGLQQKDLIPCMGSSGVVSEVFSKKRGLSKAMIRNLSEFLHIEQHILNTAYELEPKKTKKIKILNQA